MSCRLHSVEKPPAYLKNGVAGAVPPTGTRGGSPSNIAPFRGKGFGDRDNKSEVYFKNSLFIQAEQSEETQAVFLCPYHKPTLFYFRLSYNKRGA